MRDILTVAAYAGSKNHIVDKYIPLIPFDSTDVYVEPFGGMFGVGLNKPRQHIEIYNDLNPKLALLMSLLSNRDTGYEMLEIMCHFDFTSDFYDYIRFACEYYIGKRYDTFMGALIWANLLMSYNGLMKQFRNVSDIKEALCYQKKLFSKCNVVERMSGVQVYNENGLDIINAYKNRKDAFLFLDPPYTAKNDYSKIKRSPLYEREMLLDKEHKKFLNSLEDASAKIIVCSYKNDIYDDILCGQWNWKRLAVAKTYKSMRIGGRGQKQTEVTEYVYMNYDV